MIEIRHGNQTWEAPADWSEVTVRRYIDVCQVASLAPPGPMPAAVLNKLLAAACGAPVSLIQQMPAGKALELAALVGFIWATPAPKHMAPAICLAGEPIPDGEWLLDSGEIADIADGQVQNWGMVPASARAVCKGFGCMKITNRDGAAHIVGVGPDGRLTIGGGTYVAPADFESVSAGHFADLESLGQRIANVPEGQRGRYVLKALPEILAALYLRPGEDYLTSPSAPRMAAFERAPVGLTLGALDFFLHRVRVSASVGPFSLEQRTKLMETQGRLSLWSLYILLKRSGGGTLRVALLGALLKCAGYWPFPRSNSSLRWRWKKPTPTTSANSVFSKP